MPAVNNGYNCNHPEQDEVEYGIGCCFSRSCPIARKSCGTTCQEFGVECENCGSDYCFCDDDMMLCEIRYEEFSALYKYKRKYGEADE